MYLLHQRVEVCCNLATLQGGKPVFTHSFLLGAVRVNETDTFADEEGLNDEYFDFEGISGKYQPICWLNWRHSAVHCSQRPFVQLLLTCTC